MPAPSTLRAWMARAALDVRTLTVPALALSAVAVPFVTGLAHAQQPSAAASGSTAATSTTTEAFTVRVTGTGSPIIFIPGLASSGEVWNETVSALCTTHQCHVLSLAGFGGTPPMRADSTWLPRVRDAIIDYVRTRRLDKPVIIGHSLGGYLALDIAATIPDLPRAIINVDGLPFLPAATIPGSTVETVRPMAQQMREQTRNPTAEARGMFDAQVRTMSRDTTHHPLILKMMRTSDAATVAEAMYALYTSDNRPAMARITAPVLNLHAWAAYKSYGQTRERLEPLLANQYAGLRNATTRINDEAYHFIMFDEPEWFLQEVRAFLAQH